MASYVVEVNPDDVPLKYNVLLATVTAVLVKVVPVISFAVVPNKVNTFGNVSCDTNAVVLGVNADVYNAIPFVTC